MVRLVQGRSREVLRGQRRSGKVKISKARSGEVKGGQEMLGKSNSQKQGKVQKKSGGGWT